MKKAEIEKLKAENAALRGSVDNLRGRIDGLMALQSKEPKNLAGLDAWLPGAQSPSSDGPEVLTRAEQGAVVDAITASEHATISLREILRGVGRSGEPGRSLSKHAIGSLAASVCVDLTRALRLVGRAADPRNF